MAKLPGDDLGTGVPLSGPPVPNMGGNPPPASRPPRPPAVMGPMQGTNGRPRTSSDSLTVGQQNPNSPYRLPGPPPPDETPAPAPAPVPGGPAPAPAAPPAGQPAQFPDSGQGEAPATAGAAPVAAPGVPTVRPRMVISSTQELPAGVEVDTQIGKAYKDPTTGRVSTTLNSAGQAAHQRAYASQLRKFGTYFGSDDPNHPKPPLQPGIPMFNPDNGQWVI